MRYPALTLSHSLSFRLSVYYTLILLFSLSPFTKHSHAPVDTMRLSVLPCVLLAVVLCVSQWTAVHSQQLGVLWNFCVCPGGCTAETDSGYSFYYECLLTGDPEVCKIDANCNDICYKACAVCYGGIATATCASLKTPNCECIVGFDNCITVQPGPMPKAHQTCINQSHTTQLSNSVPLHLRS